MKKEFKKCCAKAIKEIWETGGGSMNIVRYMGKCPKCKHFIGLTQTSEKEADELLKLYDPTRSSESNS